VVTRIRLSSRQLGFCEENVMLDTIWASLQDESTRTVLGWIGGGLVVVIGGLWTVFMFFSSREQEKKDAAPNPTVSATHGGVAVGRDIKGSPINISRPKR
jgi:hypothetical protein